MTKRKATCTGNSHFWMGDYDQPCDCGKYASYDAAMKDVQPKPDAPPVEERRKTRLQEYLERRWNEQHHNDESEQK
jgi:hypothetical protein